MSDASTFRDMFKGGLAQSLERTLQGEVAARRQSRETPEEVKAGKRAEAQLGGLLHLAGLPVGLDSKKGLCAVELGALGEDRYAMRVTNTDLPNAYFKARMQTLTRVLSTHGLRPAGGESGFVARVRPAAPPASIEFTLNAGGDIQAVIPLQATSRVELGKRLEHCYTTLEHENRAHFQSKPQHLR